MSTSNLKSTKDLLAKLDAEFGKKPRKAKVEGKLLPGGATTQRSSTGGFSDLANYSNAVSASWRNQPGWRPFRRQTHIINEHCCNCSGSVSYIGNVFTVFINSRLRARISAPELITHDELGLELPHELDEHHHDVEFCVSCLRLSSLVEDHLAVSFINGVPKQIGLSFPGVRDEK